MNEAYQSGMATADITSFTAMNSTQASDGAEVIKDEKQREAQKQLVAPYQYILKHI